MDLFPKSLYAGIILAVLTVFGGAMAGFVHLLDPYSSMSIIVRFFGMIVIVLRSILVSITICIQAILAPINFAFIVSSSIHHWFTYDKFEWFPLFSEITTWLLDTTLVSWIGIAYKLVITGFSLRGLIEGIFDL